MALDQDKTTSSGEGERRVKVTLYMPRDVLERLREYSERTGTAQSRLLSLLVQTFLDGVEAGAISGSIGRGTGSIPTSNRGDASKALASLLGED